MWNVICRSCIAASLAIAALAVMPARVQTQSTAPVREHTQHLGFNGGTTSAIDTTGANLLVACVSWYGNLPRPRLQDSKGNSWTLAVEATGAIDSHVGLFYSSPAANQVDSAHTFTIDQGDGSQASINVTAWAGAAASPLDQSSEAFADSTLIQPGPVTPTQDNELIVSCLTNAGDYSNNSRSINGGFTISGQLGYDLSTYSTAIAGAYLVQTTAAAADPTWSYSPSNTANAVIATFKRSGTTTTTLPQLFSNSLQYLGGFRIPEACGGDTFGYGGDEIAFSATGNNGQGSLYIASRRHNVAEFSIPEPRDNPDLDSLLTANCLSAVAVDPTEGRKTQGDGPGSETSEWAQAHPTGMVVTGGKLWVNNGRKYDGNNSQTVSLASRPLDLSVTGQVNGLFNVYDPLFTPSAGTHGVALNSSDWVNALDGDLLLSKFNTSRLVSFGPSAIAIDSSSITPSQTTYSDAKAVLFYPESESLAGPGDPGDVIGRIYTIWSQVHGSGSIVQPRGTSTLLVFQTAGATKADSYGYRYGCGCSAPVEPGSMTCSDPPSTCDNPAGFFYDPGNTSKGGHGYPYIYQVLAYDMNDLVAVKNGTKAPWEPRPYASWELTSFPLKPRNALGNARGDTRLSNATYDSATNTIYIAQTQCCDYKTVNGYDPYPIIHAFRVVP